jgi:hypothetical protein
VNLKKTSKLVLICFQCDARHQHMFQQLANALNLEVSAIEDFLFGDERVRMSDSSSFIMLIFYYTFKFQLFNSRRQLISHENVNCTKNQFHFTPCCSKNMCIVREDLLVKCDIEFSDSQLL